MGDRKTDAAECLEDRVCLDMDKLMKDMFKFDKGVDMAASVAIAQGITQAGTVQHQITQNAVLVSSLTNLMTVGTYAVFLKQLLGIDVQTILEAALMKAAGDAMSDAVESEPKPSK